MKVRPLTLAVVLALGGCTLSAPHTTDTTSKPPTAGTPVAVASRLDATPPPVGHAVDAFSYRILTPEETGLKRVFDDGRSTFVEFNTPGLPPSLMIFDHNGKQLGYSTYGNTAMLNSVHEGLLIRTPAKSSYAQPASPADVARVRALKPGMAGTETIMPPDLASARARVLAAQTRLKTLAGEIDKASQQQQSALSIEQVRSEIEELETQIAGINATLVLARFQSGSTQLALSSSTKTALLDAAKRSQRIVVRGRTDSTGDSTLNSRIALARAVSGRKLLIEGGIAPAKVQTTYSTGHYVASNHTEDGRAKNRRVEFVLFSPNNQRIRLALSDDGLLDGDLAALETLPLVVASIGDNAAR